MSKTLPSRSPIAKTSYTITSIGSAIHLTLGRSYGHLDRELKNLTLRTAKF